MRYVILILVMAGLVLLLRTQFPYVIDSNGDMARITYLAGLIALIAGGAWASGRYRFSQVVQQSLIWLAIILGLVLLYSYRDQLQWKRIKAELFPNQIQATMDGGLSVVASEDGHFHIEAELNGVPVNFIVDTGASDIVLSPGDAERIGYALDFLNYTRSYNTANGVVLGAPVVLETFRMGNLLFRGIPASVNSTPMNDSLLGMSFLRQFRSYHVDGDVLTLYP